ncbi:MAG: fibrobacter succinogenes major paralogous domain-containing protein [Prevotella sp.]|jgi:uncharacterized protein (TIGR02145 family)|nr:fibrobacter succinogenes major paralogous domain-containing protein [Prevotella sp.]
MKNRTIKNSIIVLVLLISLNNILPAQVTIGAGIEPNKGALLDLKENNGDNSNITASKGFILPRVQLTDPGNLYPMFSPDNAGGYKEGVKPEEDKLHTGLSVYHIDECSLEGAGLYLWSGSRWTKLSEHLPGHVYRVTDPRDGETYLARNFGPQAGDWMLENIRYQDPDIPLSKKGDAGFSDAIQSRLKRYFYPNGTNDGIPSTWNKKQGLLYTYAAATMGKQNTTDFNQGQVAGNSPGVDEVETVTGHIQGICPAGWHVPSDREWNMLEKEIYNNPEKYSGYVGRNAFNPAIWNPIWESRSVASMRGSSGSSGHAYAMLSVCPAVGKPISVKGKSLPATSGGFDALPVGYANDGEQEDYGGGSYFWTSSAAGKDGTNSNMLWAWDRILTVDQQQVLRYTYARNALFSVRCKKD